MYILAGALLFVVIFLATREICIFKKGRVWIHNDAYTVYPLFLLHHQDSLFCFLSGLDFAVAPPTPLYVGFLRIRLGHRGMLIQITPWLGFSIAIVLIAGIPPIRIAVSRSLADWYIDGGHND